MAEYLNATETLWVRGTPPGGLIVGDPDDPQIGRLLARGQIKPKHEAGFEVERLGTADWPQANPEINGEGSETKWRS